VSIRHTTVVRALFGLGVLLPSPLLAGDTPYAWGAPSAQSQLYSDTTPVPVGKGALFVPSLTGGDDEPQVLLVDGATVVPIPVGRRVVVDPGRYVVVAGPQDPGAGQGVPIEVLPARTALVPVGWGALRIETVDKQLARFGAPFELVEVDSGRVVKLQVDETREIKTWLLAPGLYRIREPGSDRITAPDFVTVHVPKGGLANVRVFADRRTGEFLGGGVIPLDATIPDADADDSLWTGALVLSLDGTVSQVEHVAGALDSTLVSGRGFLDGRADYRSGFHTLNLAGNLTQGQQYLELLDDRPLPLLKTDDNLSGSARYALYMNDALGLYAGGEASTQLLETVGVATEDVTIAVRKTDGSVNERTIAGGETYRLADPMAPTRLGVGAGLSLRFLDVRWADVSVRGGVGWRRFVVDGVLVSEDNPNTPALEFTELADFDQAGLEAGATVAFKIKSFASVASGLDAFYAFDSFDSPSYRWTNDLSLRLTDIVSAHYEFDAEVNPRLTSELAVRQGAFLRATWSLL